MINHTIHRRLLELAPARSTQTQSRARAREQGAKRAYEVLLTGLVAGQPLGCGAIITESQKAGRDAGRYLSTSEGRQPEGRQPRDAPIAALEKSAARTSPALLPMHVPGRSRVSGAIAIA